MVDVETLMSFRPVGMHNDVTVPLPPMRICIRPGTPGGSRVADTVEMAALLLIVPIEDAMNTLPSTSQSPGVRTMDVMLRGTAVVMA